MAGRTDLDPDHVFRLHEAAPAGRDGFLAGDSLDEPVHHDADPARIGNVIGDGRRFVDGIHRRALGRLGSLKGRRGRRLGLRGCGGERGVRISVLTAHRLGSAEDGNREAQPHGNA